MNSDSQKMTRIKRTKILVIILTLIVSCRQEKPPLKIGFSLNLTPPTTISMGVRNGVLMAVNDINAAGGINGHKIELIIKNDRLDPETAIKVDQELIRENVAAIIGHIHSEMSIAAISAANQAKTVMISPISATKKLTGVDDYFFRVVPLSLDTSTKTAQYAFENGQKRIVVIYDLTHKAYSENKYLEFKKLFETMGGKILFAQPFSSRSDSAMPELVKALKDKKPDSYYIVADPPKAAIICQHLRMIGADKPILVSPWAYDPVFIENGGTAVEGVVFSHSFQKDSRNPAFLEFKENYIKRYKTMPWLWATCGYETVMILSQALSRNPDPGHLKETLLKTGPFQGLQGDILFDRYGDNRKKPLLYTVINGEFVAI